MIQKSVSEDMMVEKVFTVKVEQGNINFYETEEMLLNYLYRLEKVEAQRALRVIIENVNRSSRGEKLKGITYYFITLTGIMARYMWKHDLAAEKVFSFNQTCIMLIDGKLTEDNAIDIGDELIEFITYMIAERKTPLLQHHTVNKVLQHINSEVESPLTVDGISSKFDVSTSHLSRIFREHAEITLVEYINVRKVEEAQYYLRFSDEKIADISNHFHFCNQSYFTRIFKKYTGETPRKFRTNIASNYFRYKLPGEES